MPPRNSKGFTLIELMITVVIIGILAAIAVPNFLSMQNRAKEASVKANCHTVSLAAEDFAIITGGIYPASIAPMMPYLPGGVLLANPFTGTNTEPRLGNAPGGAGQVTYEPTNTTGITDGYVIRGAGIGGAVIILVLTNGTVI